MNKLKPCPFCGGEAELLAEEDSIDSYWVRCPNSECSAKTFEYSCGDHAINKWNTRTQDPRIKKMLDYLKLKLMTLYGDIDRAFMEEEIKTYEKILSDFKQIAESDNE